jgi:hypothetical protein
MFWENWTASKSTYLRASRLLCIIASALVSWWSIGLADYDNLIKMMLVSAIRGSDNDGKEVLEYARERRSVVPWQEAALAWHAGRQDQPPADRRLVDGINR